MNGLFGTMLISGRTYPTSVANGITPTRLTRSHLTISDIDFTLIFENFDKEELLFDSVSEKN